jgi:hypothetical protein
MHGDWTRCPASAELVLGSCPSDEGGLYNRRSKITETRW